MLVGIGFFLECILMMMMMMMMMMVKMELWHAQPNLFCNVILRRMFCIRGIFIELKQLKGKMVNIVVRNHGLHGSDSFTNQQ